MSAPPKPRNRDSVFLIARIAEPGKDPQRFRVRNLSREGVCVEPSVGLEKGDRLLVSIGQLDHIQAEVAWARGGLAGLKFMRPIDTALARRRRLSGFVEPSAASALVGWLSERRPAHRNVRD